MKKFVSILVGLMTLPLMAFGAAYDATLSNGGSQITIGSNTFTVTGRESLMDSITVSDSNISITTTAGLFLQLTSADRLEFTVSPSAYKTGFTCGSSESVLTVEAGQSISTTITITPGSTCSGGDSGGGGGDSGGGGGGSISSYSYAPATSATPAVAPATPAASAVQNASSVAQAVSPVFNKDLARGARNDDVKRVQQLLAADKALYPEGLTTGLYGPATERAVRAFQKKYGLPQVGRIGPATRAKLNEVYGGAKPAEPAKPAEAPKAAAPDADTSALQSQIQQLLNQVKALQEQSKSKSQPAVPAVPAPTNYDPFAPKPGNQQIFIGT